MRARGLVLSFSHACGFVRKATGCFVSGENQDTSLVKCDTLIVLVFFTNVEKKV